MLLRVLRLNNEVRRLASPDVVGFHECDDGDPEEVTCNQQNRVWVKLPPLPLLFEGGEFLQLFYQFGVFLGVWAIHRHRIQYTLNGVAKVVFFT